MEIINGLHNLRPRHRGCVLTIGNFDGVHRGHRQLIDALCEKAKALGVPSMLMTFEPQPREFFAGTKLPARLTRFREKVYLLDQTPLDRLLCLPFNERTANIEADWFAKDFVVDQVGAKHLVIGDDFRFGRGREGDFALFESYGQIHGYSVSAMSTLLQGEARISSTLIRETLAAGDFTAATNLLGHEYFIMGRVVYGRQLGRQLNVPTANIRLQRYRAALEGVYCVTVEGIAGAVRHGIANIGVRPTVDGKEPLLEVHVFDYTGNLYGDLIKVTFKQKLREEQAFDSIDALKTQINRDIQQARHFFED
ncbi:MAG: bifunctional riboflavin kinase/FAD synthetase [Pseudomonadales bacterium]|nr:bifunctional riboflavin kinase/FAD synthetase [Pseudomonadales bacterium]MBL6814197.1 bifunctional riboflavin kinase/FAD synthetase [Pseudomonadales bacterium]